MIKNKKLWSISTWKDWDNAWDTLANLSCTSILLGTVALRITCAISSSRIALISQQAPVMLATLQSSMLSPTRSYDITSALLENCLNHGDVPSRQSRHLWKTSAKLSHQRDGGRRRRSQMDQTSQLCHYPNWTICSSFAESPDDRKNLENIVVDIIFDNRQAIQRVTMSKDGYILPSTAQVEYLTLI